MDESMVVVVGFDMCCELVVVVFWMRSLVLGMGRVMFVVGIDGWMRSLVLDILHHARDADETYISRARCNA